MKEISLTQGLVAIVDDDDLLLVSDRSWEAVISPTGNAYARHVRHTSNGLVHLNMHRVIMKASIGEIVDHKNGDGLDNRRDNLRLCSSRENNRNRTRYAQRKREAGGFLGIYFHKSSGLWHAKIHAGLPDKNGEAKAVSLKYYKTAEEAARVYDSAARFFFGEFAALNFPHDETSPFDPLNFRKDSRKAA